MGILSEQKQASSVSAVAPSKNGGAVAEERRCAPRVRRSMTARVTGLGSGNGVACVVADISEGGLFLRAPAEAGVCVGQRCELALSSIQGETPDIVCSEETVFATVVRTLPVGSGRTATLGAGLRFDQPLYL